MSTLRESLDVMTDRELVAYWNIMQFPGIFVGEDRNAVHKPVVSDLLAERGIAHELGKLTDRVAA